MPSRLDTAIENYLEDRGATLWGRAWDLSQEESKEGARRFIRNLYRDLWSRMVYDWAPRTEPSTAAPSATGPISTEEWLHPSKSSARTGA